MKKIILSIFTILIILLNGCSDYLEPELYGSLSPISFPSNETEYELYMLELYKPFLGSWGYQEPGTDWTNSFYSPERGHLVMNDLPTDIFLPFTDWGGFWEGQSTGNFNYMLTEGRGESHFEKIRFVTRSTQIIGDLEKADIIPASKKQFIAEAHMARGFIMFYLLQYYGPVPVILDYNKIGNEAVESDLTRPSRDFYVNAVISDLRHAADSLEIDPVEYGRFNKGLALTILMRLYMNEKDFVNAESVGREIEGLGYKLVSDYSSLFKEATEQNTETIWAVSCSPDNSELLNFNPYVMYCYPSDFKGPAISGGYNASSVFTVSWDFYDSFDSLDSRRTRLIAQYYNKNTGALKSRTTSPALKGPIIQKYLDEGLPGNPFTGNDIVIARYADVMLMLAEAINNNNGGPTSEAIELVDSVRSRAGIGKLPSGDIASQQAFNDAILRERGWELYFEGLRKMDLIRHGKWPSALAAVGKNANAPVLCPIPTYAINLSGDIPTLIQNPGYE